LNQAPEREFYGEELNTQDKVVLVVLLHRKANSKHQDISEQNKTFSLMFEGGAVSITVQSI
jgi:hypothetical protein